MSIVELRLDEEHGKLTTGLKIDRDTMLYSRAVGGVPCKFRTCYDTTLWPVSVTAAEWKTPDQLRPPLRAPDAAYALRLVVNSAPDVPLPKLKCDHLRFHLTGESNLVKPLYKLLCSKLARIVIRNPANSKISPVISCPLPRSAQWDSQKTKGWRHTRSGPTSGYQILPESSLFRASFSSWMWGALTPCGTRASKTAPNSFSYFPARAMPTVSSAWRPASPPRHFA